MEFHFETQVKLELMTNKEDKASTHCATKLRLIPSSNLNVEAYINDGMPTKEGCRAITNCLVQWLIANMSMANEMGYTKDYEHLEFIIEELKRGFVEPMESAKKGIMQNDSREKPKTA